mmetsp:Transcript_20393/g.37003  ORF Transcript_20393/g.37003 Transcript_20393/m.37003 type:complete len:926 (+) Transcript_20393:130-2907(+)|eukprot:CAMPEP_0202498402 /NCGR_PEP_ID=MMETSP1361-20130828/25870_1 /ASSEMBLY_ACC=CAM_ASM_000849 /TAXON_ID=210615 /ORGANISM="Staurosira complex sp., Strain CCMP2646" /LENGTH=925 /DNA_ID=CAMNT_0049130281 /DNA_START=80 /DNA_END=2857 /DNA_ORIENTATION=-
MTSIAAAAPVMALVTVLAFAPLPCAMAFEPMRSKPEIQTRKPQRFLYLGENGEPVPADKSGRKKKDDMLMRVASAPIEENEIEVFDKEEEDTSLPLSLLQFESISQNLDGILADISKDLGDVEQKLIYKHALECANDQDDVNDKEEIRARRVEEQQVAVEEGCGSQDEIMSVAWTLEEDGECDSPSIEELLDENCVTPASDDDVQATLSPKEISPAPMRSSLDTTQESPSLVSTIIVESEALHRSLLKMRLELESREKARRQAMLTFIFQQSLLQARLSMETRARQVTEIDRAKSSNMDDKSDLQQVATESEALYRSLLTARLEREAREKASGTATRLAREAAVAVLKATMDEDETSCFDPIVDVAIGESEDEITIASASMVEEANDNIFPLRTPLSEIGEEKVRSPASSTTYHRQVSATSLASSATTSDLVIDEAVDIASTDVEPQAENEIQDIVVETRPDYDTREAVGSLESAFTREDPETAIKITPMPPKEAPPASAVESSMIDRFEELLVTENEVADNSNDGDEHEEKLQTSFKVTPTPPKEAPPSSVIESHAEQEDKIVSSSKSQPLFLLDTLGEELQIIKQQDDLAIAKNALTHFTKAAVGGGLATLLTLGSIVKAASSSGVVSSAKAVSSSVFEATGDPEDKSVSGVAKDIGSVAASIAAVGSAFLRSFEHAAVSSHAAEAGTDAAKEFALLLASLVAFSLKQGDRIQETLLRNLVENSAAGKLTPEALGEALESVMKFGIKQGERALESFADLKDNIATATTGIATEMKKILRSDPTVAANPIPEQQVDSVDSQLFWTNVSIENIERNVNVNGFAFEEKAETQEHDTIMPFNEVTVTDPPSDKDNVEALNDVRDQSANVNVFALDTQEEIGRSTLEEEYLEFSAHNNESEEDTLGSPMTNDEAALPEEDSYFFATFD